MSVRIGAQGASVRQIQQRLDENGARLAVDGKFGNQTDAAVRAFQASHGLQVDGIVGRDTARALGLSGDSFEPAPARRGGASSASGSSASGGASRAGGAGAAPADPLGPPMTTENAPGANPTQKLTSLMRNQRERLAYYHDRGITVPPQEQARAQRMMQLANQVDVLPLATGEGGRDIADFGTARADLRDELARH